MCKVNLKYIIKTLKPWTKYMYNYFYYLLLAKTWSSSIFQYE
jgi:hypothetical protein